MKREPTQKYLMECFDYVDGKLYWKERPKHHFKNEHRQNLFNSKYASKESGYFDYHKKDNNYRCKITLCNRGYRRSRLIWVFFFGDIPKGMIIDHIDGDTLNDQIENLRLVSNQINSWNKGKYKNNKSGVTGVYKYVYKRKGKKYDYWIAETKDDNGKKKAHYHRDFFEAVCTRKSWEINHPHITENHGTR